MKGNRAFALMAAAIAVLAFTVHFLHRGSTYTTLPEISTAHFDPMDQIAGHDADRQKAVEMIRSSALINDAQLRAWLFDDYLVTFANHGDLGLTRQKLETLLFETPRNPVELSQIGRAIYGLTSDAQTCAIIGGVVLTTGHQNLTDQTALDGPVRETIQAMKDYEPILWEANDRYANRRYVDQLSDMSLDIQRLVPPDDTRMGWMVNWARIVHGETLLLHGKFDEAWVESVTMTNDASTNLRWRESQKTGVKWLQALILFDTKKYDQALVPLKDVAAQENFAHMSQARVLLALALARTGQTERANAAFDEWIRRDHPSAHDAGPILAMINAGQTRE
jgi:hypothetical protein